MSWAGLHCRWRLSQGSADVRQEVDRGVHSVCYPSGIGASSRSFHGSSRRQRWRTSRSRRHSRRCGATALKSGSGKIPSRKHEIHFTKLQLAAGIPAFQNGSERARAFKRVTVPQVDSEAAEWRSASRSHYSWRFSFAPGDPKADWSASGSTALASPWPQRCPA